MSTSGPSFGPKRLSGSEINAGLSGKGTGQKGSLTVAGQKRTFTQEFSDAELSAKIHEVKESIHLDSFDLGELVQIDRGAEERLMDIMGKINPENISNTQQTNMIALNALRKEVSSKITDKFKPILEEKLNAYVKEQPVVGQEVKGRMMEAFTNKSTTLDLSGINMRTLPDVFHLLPGLQEIKLSSTAITALPETMQQSKNLEKLDLSNSGLSELPSGLEDPTSFRGLKELNLSYNPQLGIESVKILASSKPLLKSLNMSGTLVNAAELDALKSPITLNVIV